MHLDVKTFNDSSESAIRKATAHAGMSHGASLALFYQPQNKEAIIQALRNAGIPMQSSGGSSLTIKAEGLFQCTRIERALDVLKAAGFISDVFVRQISENFPNGHGGIQPFNNSHRTTLESRVTNYVSNYLSNAAPRAIDDLWTPIITETSSIDTAVPGLIRQQQRYTLSRREFMDAVQTGSGVNRPSEAAINAMVGELNSLLGRTTPPARQGASSQHVSTKTESAPLDVGKNANDLDDAGFSGEIPHNYICPISCSVMTDPVYLTDDPTERRFERSCITKWLTQKGTHPISRLKFKSESVMPDENLKNEIDGFVQTAIASAPPGLKK